MRAIAEVEGFEELYNRFRRNMSVLGRSEKTFTSYGRHLAAISLHFGRTPLELEAEDVQQYLFELQNKAKTPSQTYFKHTVFSLRFLLKSEGLPYNYLLLPEIKKEKKLPVVLSKEEMCRMLCCCKLLKHKILLGLLYGCGLRCFEVRNVRLCDLDFDRRCLHVVQGKGKKDRYVPLFPRIYQLLTLSVLGKCRTAKQGLKPGMIALLHTWGQNLSLHPHLHCIVPGGGLTEQGRWRNIRSNNRILSYENGKVRFSYKDYRSAGVRKEMELDDREFIRRFALHILPCGFMKIRHFGILSSSSKALAITQIREQFSVEKNRPREERQCKTFNPLLCPCCGLETMITIQMIRPRAPPVYVFQLAEIRGQQAQTAQVNLSF